MLRKSQYVTRRDPAKSAYSDDDAGMIYHFGPPTVDGPREPEKTGLLDQDGVPIYRVPDTVPTGFRR